MVSIERPSSLAASTIVALVALFALVGCPKKTADAADAAAEGGATADAGPEAANEADLTRYPDEQAIDHQAATIKTPKANALKATPKGDIVASLKKGDTVTELSEHNGYYRVVFADPKDASRKLEGWVVKFAFDDPPVVKKRPVPKCTGDGVVMVSDKANPIVPRCSIFCTDDKDCPSGKCDSALILNEKGEPAVVNGDTHFESVCSAGTRTGAASADAGKPKVAPPPAAVPKCASDEGLYAVDEHSKIFCSKGDSCSSDKDCGGKGTCVEAMIMQDDGTPQLSHNGTPIGGKVCKPK
jgi:hypothetical protein